MLCFAAFPEIGSFGNGIGPAELASNCRRLGMASSRIPGVRCQASASLTARSFASVRGVRLLLEGRRSHHRFLLKHERYGLARIRAESLHSHFRRSAAAPKAALS